MRHSSEWAWEVRAKKVAKWRWKRCLFWCGGAMYWGPNGTERLRQRILVKALQRKRDAMYGER